MFYGFLGITAGSIGFLVIKPLLKYMGLGQVISHEKAAHIVGDHFESVKDKLLNILQLSNQAEQSTSAELLFASINQKSEKIKLVPFKSAIDLSNNKRYLKYALPPLVLLVALLSLAPSWITDGTNRILRNNQEFIPDAPFAFSLNTDDLEVVQFQDFPLEIKVDGDVLPEEAFIMVDNYQYRLHDIKLDFPAYTGRTDERLSSIGDVIVPQGTNLNWVFNSVNTDNLEVKFGSQGIKKDAKALTGEQFTFSKKAMRDDQYTVYVSNKRIPNADSIAYLISVIPDLHPSSSTRSQKKMDERML